MVIHGPKPKDHTLWRLTIQTKKYSILAYQPGTVPKNYYGERAEFSKTTFSLRLKNLRSNESGLYQAVVTSATQDIVAEYHVTVQGMFTKTVQTFDTSYLLFVF